MLGVTNPHRTKHGPAPRGLVGDLNRSLVCLYLVCFCLLCCCRELSRQLPVVEGASSTWVLTLSPLLQSLPPPNIQHPNLLHSILPCPLFIHGGYPGRGQIPWGQWRHDVVVDTETAMPIKFVKCPQKVRCLVATVCVPPNSCRRPCHTWIPRDAPGPGGNQRRGRGISIFDMPWTGVLGHPSNLISLPSVLPILILYSS